MNMKGDCRCQAAAFYFMVKASGTPYADRIEMVNGTRKATDGTDKDHSWTEIVTNGKRRIYDPNKFYQEYVLQKKSASYAKSVSYNFKYGTSGTEHYVDTHGHNEKTEK